MMSSGRGPGVIGMVMALIVLLGFGLLFMFAFDEGSRDGRSIESVISDQAKSIEGYAQSVEAGNTRLAGGPALSAAHNALAAARSEIKSSKARAAALTGEIAAGKEAIEAKTSEWEDYKNDYRATVRGQAKGTSLPTLETADGTVYKDVQIREVSAIGMQIRHSAGFKRIAFEDLSAEMKDYYQFDPDQKDAALAREVATRAEHDAAVAVAGDRADAAQSVQREKDRQVERDKLIAQIAAKEAQTVAIISDLRGLDGDLQREAAEVASARAAGRMHLDGSSRINARIRGKQNQLSALRADIARMKSKL